jgi:hypothetical protein
MLKSPNPPSQPQNAIEKPLFYETPFPWLAGFCNRAAGIKTAQFTGYDHTANKQVSFCTCTQKSRHDALTCQSGLRLKITFLTGA